MMKIILGAMFCVLMAGVSASAQTDYCFQNNGIEFKKIVSYTLTKNKIEGTFESGGYNPDTSMETFDFTGTKNGNVLTIKFVGKNIPYDLPPGTKKIVWTLGKSDLKIPTNVKNEKTKKSSTIALSYGQCKE